jgi:flagellar motor switch protein FliG
VAGLATKRDVKSLRGPERAAVFLLALDEERAVKILSQMHDDEIRELSQTMSTLGKVPADVVERLFLDFADRLSSAGSLVGTYETVERLLAKSMQGERVQSLMEEIRGPAGRTMWDKLGNVNEVVLANYLKNERPQTQAAVLAQIKPQHAARVLAALPHDSAMEIIQRMLSMEPVQKEVLESVEKTLRVEFMSNLARTNQRDSHEVMAEIFNSLDRASEERFLTALETSNREASERIRALMFTFEDLLKLDPSGVQTLLRAIDKSKLAVALKGSSEGVRNLFFTNMSERAGKILREDMEAMGPVRLRDVDEAQQYIVQTAKQLANKGEIVIADNKGDDELVY